MVAAIHRQITAIAKEQEWKPLSYERVHQIIGKLPPALVMLAHEGADEYREEFDLLYRLEATHANAIRYAIHARSHAFSHVGTSIIQGEWEEVFMHRFP